MRTLVVTDLFKLGSPWEVCTVSSLLSPLTPLWVLISHYPALSALPLSFEKSSNFVCLLSGFQDGDIFVLPNMAAECMSPLVKYGLKTPTQYSLHTLFRAS